MKRERFIFACFHQRDHTFMTSTRKGGHVLKFVRICLFLRMEWVGGPKLFIFCGRHKCMTPNGMFLNLGVSCLESLGGSSIFLIYNFLDLFELKIKLSIVIMSFMVSDETMEVLFIYN